MRHGAKGTTDTIPTPEGIDSCDIHNGLQKIFELSALLDYPFTLDEIAKYFLPGINITSEELRELLLRKNFFAFAFQIDNGYVLTRAGQSEAMRLEREEMTSARLESATQFSRILSRLTPHVKMIAVTGGVAYGSAGKWDDIDLFMVTERNRLWLTTLVAFAFLRISKILGLRPRGLLSFCLSYVHDEYGFAQDSLRNLLNPLFARELLMAKPVLGVTHYREILAERKWVAQLYAKAYADKMRELELSADELNTARDRHEGRLDAVHDWAEGIVYILLSRYLRLRAYLTNLKLKSQRNNLRVFEPRITPESCVYTSNFYRWLHEVWGEL